MLKKISFSIIALALIVVGIFAFNRLHYWDRSVQIFKVNNERSLVRGFDRGRTTFDRSFFNRGGNTNSNEENSRRDFRNVPDSVRQRASAQRQFQAQPDSIRQAGTGTFPGDQNSFRERNFERNGGGRGGFRSRSNVQLRSVTWFLAVFAGITVITIYIDKSIKLIRRRKKQYQKLP